MNYFWVVTHFGRYLQLKLHVLNEVVELKKKKNPLVETDMQVSE